MKKKPLPDQQVARRKPQQARSQQKVELMLEAAMRLLEEGDVASLTTNAVAAKAGVSIGTLYQYFDSKQALLDAMVRKEMGALATQVLGTLEGESATQPGERIRRIMRAVVGTYGGRTRVHRLLMQYALTHSPSDRLSPLYARLMAIFTAEGFGSPGQPARKLTPAQAFVITHGIAGVMRALTSSTELPPLEEIEDAVVQMALGYGAALAPSQA
jgi:AcrR family transcriptional regulator